MKLRAYLSSIDIFLLFFLTFFTIDKVVAKPVLIFIGLLWVFKSLSLKDVKSAPLFYVLMPLLGLINLLLINNDFSSPHIISFSIGVIYWLMAFFAFIIISKRVNSTDTNANKIQNTLNVFFVVNCIWSVTNLIMTMVHSHSLNPYMLADEAYGNSTGDYIKGIFMGPSYINMFVNCFFCVFYLYKGKYKMAILAAIIACITTSNFAIIIFIFTLLLCAVIIKGKPVKYAIAIMLLIFGGFYYFISSTNLTYVTGTVKVIAQNDTTQSNNLVKEDRVKKMRVAALKPKITSDTTRKQVAIVKPEQKSKLTIHTFDKYKYGKLVSFSQTYNYLTQSVKNFLFGAGIGEFSSQLAVRTSDLPVPQKSRIFDRLPGYVAPAFYDNHYSVFYSIYILPTGYHSIRHLPNSVVNQVFGEYGVIGAIVFFVFYVFFFLKRYKRLTYVLPMILIFGYSLLFDYMFEYLSVAIFFELFYLLNLKETEGVPLNDLNDK